MHMDQKRNEKNHEKKNKNTHRRRGGEPRHAPKHLEFAKRKSPPHTKPNSDLQPHNNSPRTQQNKTKTKITIKNKKKTLDSANCYRLAWIFLILDWIGSKQMI